MYKACVCVPAMCDMRVSCSETYWHRCICISLEYDNNFINNIGKICIPNIIGIYIRNIIGAFINNFMTLHYNDQKNIFGNNKKHQNSGQLAKTSWFSSHIWLLALGFKINICVLMICPILLAESKVLLVQSLCLAVEPHFPFQFFRVKPVNPFTPNCLMAMFDYQRINPQFWWSPHKILA